MFNPFTILILLSVLILIQKENQKSEITPQHLIALWPLAWIVCPDVPRRDYGVCHFRIILKIEWKE